MNYAEFVFLLSIGLIIGYMGSQLLNPSFETGYQKGWDDYKTQTQPFLEQAKGIVNECADKAMIVINERDTCNIELAVCKNELYYYKGVN